MCVSVRKGEVSEKETASLALQVQWELSEIFIPMDEVRFSIAYSPISSWS